VGEVAPRRVACEFPGGIVLRSLYSPPKVGEVAPRRVACEFSGGIVLRSLYSPPKVGEGGEGMDGRALFESLPEKASGAAYVCV
jgi:hypothetical protein